MCQACCQLLGLQLWTRHPASLSPPHTELTAQGPGVELGNQTIIQTSPKGEVS